MRKTVALFKNVRFNYETVLTAQSDGTFYNSDGELVQISRSMEIEFPELPANEVVKNQLDALDASEKSIRKQFADALMTIENKRAELRALTYTPEE